MKEPQFLLEGQRSELIVYENRLVLVEKIDGRNTCVYKDIFFRNIETIYIIPSGKVDGSIVFRLKNNKNYNLNDEANNVEYRLLLKRNNYKQENLKAFEIKSYIEEQIFKQDYKKLKEIASEIKEYKWLLEEGIITQEEFDMKKKRILEL